MSKFTESRLRSGPRRFFLCCLPYVPPDVHDCQRGNPPVHQRDSDDIVVLHEKVLLLTVETALTPRVDEGRRLSLTDCGGGFQRAVLRYGFSESPDVPEALAGLKTKGFDPARAAWFPSRQTLIPSRRPGMPIRQERLFAAMVRNSQSPMSLFKLPVNRVVELGSQIEI